MATQYEEEFKKDAVRYWKEHPELSITKCAQNLGIPQLDFSIPLAPSFILVFSDKLLPFAM